MLRREAEYPTQSTVAYLRRVLKCSLLLAFTTPVLYGIIVRTVRLLGIEHDEVGAEQARMVAAARDSLNCNCAMHRFAAVPAAVWIDPPHPALLRGYPAMWGLAPGLCIAEGRS